MFDADPKARGDLKAGVVYAIAAPDGSIFYGQVCPDKSVAFFERRDQNLADAQTACVGPILSRFVVFHYSIGEALRGGVWRKLGRAALQPELETDRYVVQWPVGTLTVSVWFGDRIVRTTRIEDPAIQAFEIMSVWDAAFHVPLRLLVDCSPSEAENESSTAWSVGGPVWRERRVREEYARRFPGRAHALPADWAPTSTSDRD